MVKISRKTRNRFKEHTLQVDPKHLNDQAVDVPWLNEGRVSQAFECRGHCDWAGWIPVDELLALQDEKNKG